MDTKGFGTPTEILMSLMLYPCINKYKNSEGLNKVTMKRLTIPSLDMTTEGKFVFDIHIYSSREFLFTFAYTAP